ncbi:hypothetical protein IJZ97_00220 [bacterium]|nr:hypothetical protein [bacterium]
MKIIGNFKNSVIQVFKPKKRFSFGDDIHKFPVQKTHSIRVSRFSDISVDEMVVGNKKRVLITKHDYSQNPLITAVTRKEKGFENGKLVYSDTERYYNAHEYLGDIREAIGWYKLEK